MPMTDEHIKEQLSKSYANAIAADAGIIFRDLGGIDYGLDGRFADVDTDYDDVKQKYRYSENGFGIDVQLKASTNVEIKKGMVYYDLEVKNYADLIKTNVGSQRILVLYYLPKQRNDWLKSCNTGTSLHNCAWWLSLRGKSPTSNTATIRISIPETQLLTPDELQRLMQMVKGGACL